MSNKQQYAQRAISESLSAKSSVNNTAPFSPLDETVRAYVESHSPDYHRLTKGEVDDSALRHAEDTVSMEIYPANMHFQCVQLWFLKRGTFGRMSLGCLWVSTDLSAEDYIESTKLTRRMRQWCAEAIAQEEFTPTEIAGGQFNKERRYMVEQAGLALRTFKSNIHPRQIIVSAPEKVDQVEEVSQDA